MRPGAVYPPVAAWLGGLCLLFVLIVFAAHGGLARRAETLPVPVDREVVRLDVDYLPETRGEQP